jgi:8-oxo-(d)GTP phosphatase
MTATVRAAGGVVWRRRPAGLLEVLLVHRPAYDDWAFPKGKLESGESEPQAAIREVAEETGLRCLLGQELGQTAYADSRGRDKTVRYWAMGPPDRDPAPAHEVDDARWVELADAKSRLSYQRDLALLDALAVAVERHSGTVPVYLVRHAKAESRSGWEGDDRERPLTGPGRRQAQALVAELDGRDLTAAISSPYLRCMQTLGPLGAARDLFVQPTDALAEGASVTGALDLVRAAAANGPAVLSTHGDTQQGVVERLARDGCPIDGPLAFEKRSTWILDVASGAVSAARYSPPPV